MVDQMRADYLDRFAGEYKNGLKTLSEKSTVYSKARLDHVPTETGPGHATIATGQPPGINGIIANTWFDRDNGKSVYSVSDPQFGIGPAHLMAPTLGDVLKSTEPLSHVVALSFKDRSAVCLGGKKADLVLWYNEKAKRFVTSGAYPQPGLWLDKFNNENPLRSTSTATPATDTLVMKLVKTSVNEMHLGEDDRCDLLAVSFSATDLIGHVYGPDSPQMHRQLLALDSVLGELLQLLDQKTQGNFVLALTADHGVSPIPESPAGKTAGAKRLMDKVLDKQLEESCERLYGVQRSSWVTAAYIPDVYLNRALVNEKKLNWGDFLLRLSEEWRKIPNVAAVYLNNPLISQDKFGPTYQRSYMPGRSGDLFIRMKEGVLLTDRATGTTHGSPYDDDARVPLLFYGTGFPHQKFDKEVSNEIIPYTLAHAIGIEF